MTRGTERKPKMHTRDVYFQGARMAHLPLHQIARRIEKDLPRLNQGVPVCVYRFQVARTSLHQVGGDSLLGAWSRQMEIDHGITICAETLRADEVLLIVTWGRRRVPA